MSAFNGAKMRDAREQEEEKSHCRRRRKNSNANNDKWAKLAIAQCFSSG